MRRPLAPGFGTAGPRGKPSLTSADYLTTAPRPAGPPPARGEPGAVHQVSGAGRPGLPAPRAATGAAGRRAAALHLACLLTGRACAPCPRNLPFKISAEELYDIFGKYGPIRQIRLCVPAPAAGGAQGFVTFATPPRARRGNTTATRGTAFVVYEDIYDAKNAVDHLSGFNVCGRYLVVLYYQPAKMQARVDTEKKKKELEELKKKYGMT